MSARKAGRCQKMNINETEARTGQAVPFDEREELVIVNRRNRGKLGEKGQNLLPVFQMTARKLSDNERMAHHVSVLEESRESRIPAVQMVHPDRCVHQDHDPPCRRRWIGPSFFSVPPSAASLRLLSRAMMDSRPRRTKDVFSLIPVRREARANSASSIFSVVLMHINMH
jgi:hypothetical protein